jgi:hypothetical protein
MSVEHPQCWTQANRRARKPHKCCECRGVIVSGETYVYFSGVWDGTPATYKTCRDCDELRSILNKEQRHDEAIPFGQLSEVVMGRNKTEEVRRYIQTKRKRGAEVPTWMEKRLAKLISKAQCNASGT